jgi:hypothetical protein
MGNIAECKKEQVKRYYKEKGAIHNSGVAPFFNCDGTDYKSYFFKNSLNT